MVQDTRSGVRRLLTPAQQAIAPLAPIFAACKKRGLVVTPENRTLRLRAVNALLSDLPGGSSSDFDWIEASFKELLERDPIVIQIVADSVLGGWCKW